MAKRARSEANVDEGFVEVEAEGVNGTVVEGSARGKEELSAEVATAEATVETSSEDTPSTEQLAVAGWEADEDLDDNLF